MRWDDYFEEWKSAGDLRQVRATVVKEVRHRMSQNRSEDWEWIRLSLELPDRKYFIAEIFRRYPIPKRLFSAMLRSAVYETNPSLNRLFVDPCLKAYGVRKVYRELLAYLQNGTIPEKAGAASALYWVPATAAEDVSDLERKHRDLLLSEFVRNEDVNLRRRILPMLEFDNSGLYSDEVRHLLANAIQIAFEHKDDFIRQRAEIKLGKRHGYNPLPY